MLIYRGDNRDEAKAYRTDGLLTRLMQGGNPATVDRVGLWEVARAHVRPERASEEDFLRRTPFLSFTENRHRAERYARGRKSGRLVPSEDPYREDAIVFELDIESAVNVGEEGVFALDYPCDMTRIEARSADEDRLELLRYIRCEFCAADNRHITTPRINAEGRVLHRLILIRVATFLKNHPRRQRYAGALRQAQTDCEWLVYPVDYVDRLKGFSARVPPASIWSAHRYDIVSDDEVAASERKTLIVVP